MKIFICEDDPKQEKHGYHYQKLYNDRRKAYGNCPRN